MKGTHFLSRILLKNAKNLLLRDIFSYSVAEEFQAMDNTLGTQLEGVKNLRGF